MKTMLSHNRLCVAAFLFFAIALPSYGDSKTEAALRAELESAKAQLASQASLAATASAKAQAAAEAGQSNAAEIKRLNAAIAEQNRLASERGNALNQQITQAKADLAQAKADLAQAKSDLSQTNARNAAATKTAIDVAAQNLAKLHAVVVQQSVRQNDLHAETEAAVAASSDAVITAAGAQTDATRQAASDASRAAAVAAQQAETARNANRALFILQIFGFAGVVAGLIAKLIQDRWAANDLRKKDAIAAELLAHKEAIAEGQRLLAIEVAKKAAHESENRDGQLYVLINSNLTAAILSELGAREALLLLLEANADRLRGEGKEVSEESLAIIEGERLKIATLKTTIADRNTQTALVHRLQERAKAEGEAGK